MTAFRRQFMVQERFGRLDDEQLARLNLPLRFSPALCLAVRAPALVASAM